MLIMLINHRIPHVLVEIYQYKALAKNEGKSPSIQGARRHPIICRHTSITQIGGPTSDTNRPTLSRVINQRHKGPHVSVLAKGEGGWSQGQVGRWPICSTIFELRRDNSLLVHNVGFRSKSCYTQPRRRWMLALLSLNELLHKRTETDVAFTREYTWDIESKER